MPAFHLMISSDGAKPRRIDFHAESPDHAFLVARNETDGIDVELWEGEKLLARVTKSGANIWKIHGSPGRANAPPARSEPRPSQAMRIN